MLSQPDGRLDELENRLRARDQIRQQLTEASEALDREGYRLDTLQISQQIAQEELDQLESLSVTGFFSALAGTKVSKTNARREEIETLEREQTECAKVIETLKKNVDQLTAQLAGFGDIDAEVPAHIPDTAIEPVSKDDDADSEQLERAIEAGESLLNYLNGMYGACNRVRRGIGITRMVRGGALLSTAMQVVRDKNAGTLTHQITDSVKHFCTQLERLRPGPDRLPDVSAMLVQLQQYTMPGSLSPGEGAGAWAELEAMIKSIVSDLQDEQRHGRA